MQGVISTVAALVSRRKIVDVMAVDTFGSRTDGMTCGIAYCFGSKRPVRVGMGVAVATDIVMVPGSGNQVTIVTVRAVSAWICICGCGYLGMIFVLMTCLETSVVGRVAVGT